MEINGLAIESSEVDKLGDDLSTNEDDTTVSNSTIKEETRSICIKVICLGDSAVGKSK